MLIFIRKQSLIFLAKRVFVARIFMTKVFPIFFLFSCSTSGVYDKSSLSWTISNKEAKTLKMGNIVADKNGGSVSIEAEIIRLLPLLFLEKGYLFFEDDINADFIVDVYSTERDYFVGWNNKKSIALEVLLRPNHTKNKLHIKTPLAAGRITARGTEGLSSSKNLMGILRAAVNKTVNAAKKIDFPYYIGGEENPETAEEE